MSVSTAVVSSRIVRPFSISSRLAHSRTIRLAASQAVSLRAFTFSWRVELLGFCPIRNLANARKLLESSRWKASSSVEQAHLGISFFTHGNTDLVNDCLKISNCYIIHYAGALPKTHIIITGL